MEVRGTRQGRLGHERVDGVDILLLLYCSAQRRKQCTLKKAAWAEKLEDAVSR